MIERKRKAKEKPAFVLFMTVGREIDTEHNDMRQGLPTYWITIVLTSQIVRLRYTMQPFRGKTTLQLRCSHCLRLDRSFFSL
jgi:hypothetical protein